jgi:2-desacetyl-2-hydroxyethyl bacteriochlorophyllide A dehydrogenase
MKAAVMHEVGMPLRIDDVAVPEIGTEEVLVETRTCGICGTDLHILSGFGYVPPLPHILGHEPAGVVAAVGNKVTNLKPGDPVAPYLFINCERCYYCRAGRHEQCTELKGILGVLIPGAFAEYFKVPATNLYRLPDNVAFDVGGLLADAVVTSVHAFKRSGLHLGDAAVVIGTGGVGLTLVQILKAAGVRVIGVDRSDASLQLAKQLGADVVGKSGDAETATKIKDFTHGFGAQCVFDCVGKSQAIRQSADYVMKCGRIVVIGEEKDEVAINTTEIAQRELEIIGSRNGTRQDMLEAIDLVSAGIVKPQIARHFPLDKINDAFDFLRRGTLGRVIIEIGKA